MVKLSSFLFPLRRMLMFTFLPLGLRSVASRPHNVQRFGQGPPPGPPHLLSATACGTPFTWGPWRGLDEYVWLAAARTDRAARVDAGVRQRSSPLRTELRAGNKCLR